MRKIDANNTSLAGQAVAFDGNKARHEVRKEGIMRLSDPSHRAGKALH